MTQQENLVGASVPRLEDGPLVRGRGMFAADVSFPFQLHMRVVRSPVAHGRIVAIDLDPQANLSSMFLDEDRMEGFWPDGEHPKTVYGAMRPLLEGTGDVVAPNSTSCMMQATTSTRRVFLWNMSRSVSPGPGIVNGAAGCHPWWHRPLRT
jgi:hypothetical protein